MKKIILLFFLASTYISFAQQKIHKVQAKETVYGISKKYNITQEELYKSNPKIEKSGLKIGDELIIPSKDNLDNTTNTKTITNNANEDDYFIYITIQPKESIYNLTKKYNITEQTLRSLNAKQLETGLTVGDVIRIPKTKEIDTKNKPIINVKEGYYLVEKGQTLYSLSKKFNVPVDDFYAENPILQTKGLTENMVLKIPVKKGLVSIEDNFLNYTVQKGDTAYNILSKYDLTIDQLLSLNPQALDGLKAGMILKLPLQKNAKIVKLSEPGKVKRLNDNKVNILLMLPFNADNLFTLKNSQAMQFYTGAKLALTKLAKEGKDVNVKVIDTKNESDIQSILATTDFSNVDAVIGPFKGGAIIEVADFLKGSGIGLISPFANAENLSTLENILIANPREEALADLVIDDIKTNYAAEQIYILTDNNNIELATYTKNSLDKLLKTNTTIVKDANAIIQPSDIVQGVAYYTPITAIMVGDNESLSKQFLNKLKTLDKDNLKAYGIKSNEIYDIYDSANAKNIDTFRDFGFVYTTAHIVNTRNEESIEILNDFKKIYCNLPNKNEQLGFDTVYDIVSRMNYKGDFLNNISKEETRLATKFAYKKVPNGKAYQNDAARLIRIPKK